MGEILWFRGMPSSSRAAGTTVPHKLTTNLVPIRWVQELATFHIRFCDTTSWASDMPAAELQGFSPHEFD